MGTVTPSLWRIAGEVVCVHSGWHFTGLRKGPVLWLILSCVFFLLSFWAITCILSKVFREIQGSKQPNQLAGTNCYHPLGA